MMLYTALPVHLSCLRFPAIRPMGPCASPALHAPQPIPCSPCSTLVSNKAGACHAAPFTRLPNGPQIYRRHEMRPRHPACLLGDKPEKAQKPASAALSPKSRPSREYSGPVFQGTCGPLKGGSLQKPYAGNVPPCCQTIRQ